MKNKKRKRFISTVIAVIISGIYILSGVISSESINANNDFCHIILTHIHIHPVTT